MTYMLHIGLHPDHVGDLETDNDHWEQWGEERPAGEAVHAYVELETSEAAGSALTNILQSGRELVPMHWENQRGTLAVVTPSDEWSKVIYALIEGSEEA